MLIFSNIKQFLILCLKLDRCPMLYLFHSKFPTLLLESPGDVLIRFHFLARAESVLNKTLESIFTQMEEMKNIVGVNCSLKDQDGKLSSS